MRVDPFFVQGLVTSLGNASATEAQLTQELSSGLRVSSLSTDPVAVGQSTLIAGTISADDSYVQSATTTESRLQVTDSTLGEVVSQLTQAVTLAVSGGDSTLNASVKAGIGTQLSEIRDQVLALANTSYLGQYIFGGSQGSVKPFTLDSASSPAAVTYNGDSALQYTTTENGQKIQTNVLGSAVFDGPGTSAFKALNQLVADFTSGASAAVIGGDSSSLTTALGALGVQRSVIDTSLALVQSTSTYAQTDEAQQTAAESSLISADQASVATGLSNVETQSQALSSVIAALDKGSLFDYLK